MVQLPDPRIYINKLDERVKRLEEGKMSCSTECREAKWFSSLFRGIALIVTILCVTAVAGCWMVNEWRLRQIEAVKPSNIEFRIEPDTGTPFAPDGVRLVPATKEEVDAEK